MNLNKEHIAFRLLTFLLISALLIPSTVKLIHVFEHHEHVVCIGDDSTHIHKVDLDCEFQKFQITTHFFHSFYNYDSSIVNHSSKTKFLTYKFLSDYKSLSFSLRGPPVLV